MLLETAGPAKLFLVGLAGFLIVGLAWLRYGDLPTYFETVAEEQGEAVQSPDRARSVRAEVRQLAAAGFGPFRERRSMVLLKIQDHGRGINETWALPAPYDRQLDLAEISLRWAAPDRVELIGLTEGVLGFDLAGGGR